MTPSKDPIEPDRPDPVGVAPTKHETRRTWRIRRILLGVIVVGVTCTFVPTALLFILQDRFVFAPDQEVLPIATYLPDGREITYDTCLEGWFSESAPERLIDCSDTLGLRGWFVPSRRTLPTCGKAPTVLLFHGMGGNRSWNHPIATALAEHGISVFLAEYRGYGGTGGYPSEHNFAIDAEAALGAVRKLPEVDANRIVYLGVSLGTGVAVRLASPYPPAGVMLISPYTSLPEVAWERLPGLPYGNLMWNKFDTISRIGSIDSPLLVVVGTNDDVVPNNLSRRVFDAAQRPEKYIELDGLGHHAVEIRMGDQAIRDMAGFVSRHASCEAP